MKNKFLVTFLTCFSLSAVAEEIQLQYPVGIPVEIKTEVKENTRSNKKPRKEESKGIVLVSNDTADGCAFTYNLKKCKGKNCGDSIKGLTKNFKDVDVAVAYQNGNIVPQLSEQDNEQVELITKEEYDRFILNQTFFIFLLKDQKLSEGVVGEFDVTLSPRYNGHVKYEVTKITDKTISVTINLTRDLESVKLKAKFDRENAFVHSIYGYDEMQGSVDPFYNAKFKSKGELYE